MTRARAERHTPIGVLLFTIALVVAFLVASPGRAATATCAKYASPSGRDSNSGTASAPFQTVGKLARSLSAGQTGCLNSGTYSGYTQFDKGGTSSSPITIRSTPGGLATLKARLYFAPTASDVTLSDVSIDMANGNGWIGMQILANRVRLLRDNITNRQQGASCIIVGDSGHVVSGVTLADSRIHDCGTPGSKYNHGIYLQNARSTSVTGNVFDNILGGWAIHLYPDADGTTIANNLIYGNYGGIVLGGSSSSTSDSNSVRDNIVLETRTRANIEALWWIKVGTGNVLTHNCVWHGAAGNLGLMTGVQVSGTITVDPLVSRTATGFSIKSTSQCAAIAPAQVLRV